MSTALKWFRLYPEIINDDKVRLLAFEDRWHYIAILCMKAGGVLDETDDGLRWQRVRVNIGLAEVDLEKMLDRLAKVRLIDRETLEPLAWDRRQFVSDHDPTAHDRLKRFREKKKSETDVKRVASALRNGHETPSETETETDTETEKKKPRAGARLQCPEHVKPQTWEDWLAVRKAKRAGPVTETVLAAMEREARKVGCSLQAAIQVCAERGWQGLNAEWLERDKPAAGKPRSAKEAARDYVSQAITVGISKARRTLPDPFAKDVIDV